MILHEVRVDMVIKTGRATDLFCASRSVLSKMDPERRHVTVGRSTRSLFGVNVTPLEVQPRRPPCRCNLRSRAASRLRRHTFGVDGSLGMSDDELSKSVVD